MIDTSITGRSRVSLHGGLGGICGLVLLLQELFRVLRVRRTAEKQATFSCNLEKRQPSLVNSTTLKTTVVCGDRRRQSIC